VEDVAALRLAAARSRPVATADTRVLRIPGLPDDCFPEGGIRRGSTLRIGPAPGGVSLALTLAAAATSEGQWAAAVGLPSLGLLAAAEFGIRLERLALVPAPGERWAAVAAALLDGMDLLLLGPPGRVRPADARRLAARAREQATVLVVLEPPGLRNWPEATDLHLSVAGATWEGLGVGHGHLQSRRVEVVVTGRRAAAREQRAAMWLPGPQGVPAPVLPAPLVAGADACLEAGPPSRTARTALTPLTPLTPLTAARVG
jgi:hypothetical protein